jgi:hypothetical protein
MRSKTWTIFRWFFFVSVACFGIFNLSVYFLLNSPPVQRLVISYLNKSLLESDNISLEVGALGVGFFPFTLDVHDFKLAEKREQGPPRYDFSIKKLGLGINLETSYLKKELSVKFIKVTGSKSTLLYDKDGNLKLPFVKSEEGPSAPFPNDTKYLVELMRAKAPRSVEILTSDIELRSEDESRIERIALKRVLFDNPPFHQRRQGMVLKVELGAGFVRNPQFKKDFDWNSLEADIKLLDYHQLLIERFVLQSPLASVNTSGKLLFPENNLKNAGIALDGIVDANAQNLCPFVELVCTGTAKITGTWASPKVSEVLPTFEGEATWQGVTIENYDLYKGQSQIKFENKKIAAEDLRIETHRGGTLAGSAEFELFGTFRYHATTAIHKFPFTELMKGLTVTTDVVEFLLDTDEAHFSGNIMLPGAKVFDIDVKGPVNVSEMTVPPLHKSDRIPLPQCKVNLHLYSDAQMLDFLGSTASCSKDQSDHVSLDKGYVKYSNGETLFLIQGKQVDLSAAAYFLGPDTKGIANIVGELSSATKKPLQFSAQSTVRDVTLFGIKFTEIEGHWGLNTEGVWGKSLSAKMGPHGGTFAQLEKFTLRFSDLNSEFLGQVSGRLGGIFSALDSVLPKNFPALDGEIKSTKVHLRGPLLEWKKWTIDTSSTVENLRHAPLAFKEASLELHCTKAVCERSKAVLSGLYSPLGDSTQNSGDLSSVILADVSEISFEKLKASLSARNVPLARVGEWLGTSDLSGNFNLSAQTEGTWAEWNGFGEATLSELRFGKQKLGGITLTATSNGSKELSILLNAQYNQIMAKLRIPKNFKGNSTLYARIKDFDPLSFLSEDDRVKYNLFSSMDAEISLEGPSPLQPMAKGKKWHSQWRGNARFSKLNFQVQQEFFSLRDALSVSYVDREVAIKNGELTSGFLTINVGGTVDFAEELYDLRLVGNAHLDSLPKLMPKVSTAKGTAHVDLRFEGTFAKPSIQGGGEIEADHLSIKDFNPAFTNLKGEFLFDGEELRIQNLSSQKGKGSLELTGNIDWRSILSGKSQYPLLGLRLSADHAQFRFPMQIVNNIDTEISGEIELAGTGIPYNLNGELYVDRAFAYRDIKCEDILREIVSKRNYETQTVSRPFAKLDITAIAEGTAFLQTTCLRTRVNADLKITGTSNTPVVLGRVNAMEGNVALRKTQLKIEELSLVFDNAIRIDPKIQTQLVARIGRYRVYVGVSGLKSAYQVNLWADPDTFDDGTLLTKNDITAMLLQGVEPARDGSSGASQLTTGILNTTANTLLTVTDFEQSLSSTVTRLTGGVVDTFSLEPTFDEGTPRLKARLGRSLGERLNLGLDLDPGPTTEGNSRQSLRLNWSLADRVSVLGIVDSSSKETNSTPEFSGQLRFQFGSN